MAADPLREVLLKVVKERHEQIEQLKARLRAASEVAAQDELKRQILQLQAELEAAEKALGQPSAAADDLADHRSESDELVLNQEALTPTPPKPPSKAALEAQIRELQTQLLTTAEQVEKGGMDPNPEDVARLKEIREKLQTAMRQIGAADAIPADVELPPKPTPSQLAEAENLIKRSMLEKRRGNTMAASDYLRKAVEVAPGAPSVLEMLGDDLMERGQVKPASEMYSKALLIQPSNASVERKYATAISKSKAVLSIEEALQLDLGKSPLTAAEASSIKYAPILSFFIPGAGQILLGEYTAGGIYFGSWLLMLLLLSFIGKFLQPVPGRATNFNMLMLIPIVAALAISIAAAFTCKKPGADSTMPSKGKVKGPKPPFDLPY